MKTTVVNNKKVKEYSYNIHRPTYWGNPFSEDTGSDAEIIVSSKEEAIENYKKWLLGEDFLDFNQDKRKWILDNLKYIKGKKIACFCKVYKGENCHGYVLAELADKDFSVDKIDEKKQPMIKEKKYNLIPPKTKMGKLF